VSHAILAIDPGLLHCGWAALDLDGRVHELGVIVNPKVGKIKSTDRVNRAANLAHDLNELIRRTGAQRIAAEAMSWPRGVAPLVSLALCWGVLVALAQSLDRNLVEVSPKDWQGDWAFVDRIDLERQLSERARRLPGAAKMLDEIRPRWREHALDAVGVGLHVIGKGQWRR
jgi:hypothetical protein